MADDDITTTKTSANEMVAGWANNVQDAITDAQAREHSYTYSICSDLKVRDKTGDSVYTAATFHDALEYCNSNNGYKVFIADGTYSFDEALTWTVANAEIYGSWSTEIDRAINNTTLLTLDAANIYVHDLYFNGKIATYSDVDNHTIETLHGGCVISHNIFDDHAGAGVYVHNPSPVTGGIIRHNRFLGTTTAKAVGSKGIYFDSTAPDWRVYDNLIKGTEYGIDEDAPGINIGPNNHIWGNKYGIVLARTGSVTSVSINDNYLDGEGQHQIYANGSSVYDLSIVGNRFRASGTDGDNTYDDIYLNVDVYPLTIIGNTFWGVTNRARYGINLAHNGIAHAVVKDNCFPPGSGSAYNGSGNINVGAIISNLLIKDNPRAWGHEGTNWGTDMTYGNIATPFDNTNHYFGLPAGGEAGPTAAESDHDYTCKGLECLIEYTPGAADGSITVDDANAHIVIAPGRVYTIVKVCPEWTVNFGSFTGGNEPTVRVTGL